MRDKKHRATTARVVVQRTRATIRVGTLFRPEIYDYE